MIKSTLLRVLELGGELPKKSSWVAPQTNLSPTQFYNLIALGYGNMIAVFISDIAVGVDGVYLVNHGHRWFEPML